MEKNFIITFNIWKVLNRPEPVQQLKVQSDVVAVSSWPGKLFFQFIVGTKHVHKLHKKSSFNKHSWAQSRQFKTHVRCIIHWVNALVENKKISIYIGEKIKKKKKEKHVWCLSHLNCGQKFTIVPQLSTQPGFMILINGNIASSNIFFLIFYVMAYLDVHPMDFFGHFFIIFVF